MNKEQQIEELHDFILNNLYKGSTHLLAENLYNAGYGNVSEYRAERELLGSQIKALKQRLNNKYIEVERLKDENAKLQEQFAKYQLASDKEILAQVKQAKIDVLNELKKKTHNYYPSIDSYCLSQHVVLVRDIDKLLEEV